MKQLRRVSNSQTIVTDLDGVVVDTSNSQIHTIELPSKDFAFTFKKFLSALVGIGMNEVKVFFAISFMVDSKGYVFGSSKGRAIEIGQELQISEKTVFNAINKLHKKGLLIRNPNCKNEYYLNPLYAWKGHQEGRAKVFELMMVEKLNQEQPNIKHKVIVTNK